MPEGTLFTCPMDPEIVQEGPGDCPICGMALEPMMPSAAAGPNPELIDFRRRLWIGAPLALAVLALEMGGMLGLPWNEIFGTQGVRWMQFLLATPVVVWIAQPFFKRGWSSIVTGNLNMWTLIAIGTGAAYAFSLVSLLLPGIFPVSLQGAHGPPLYFEAAAVIVTLILVGRALEARAKGRTGAAIRRLLALQPPQATVLRDGAERRVDAAARGVGDHCLIRPGDRLPADGVVIDGSSFIDESMMTGEPVPVARAPPGGGVGTKGGAGVELVLCGLGEQLQRLGQGKGGGGGGFHRLPDGGGRRIDMAGCRCGVAAVKAVGAA